MNVSTVPSSSDAPIRFDAGSRMSQAVAYGGHVHVSGQVADDRTASLEEQTRQVLDKVEKLISAAGASKSDLVSVAVYLPHISDFDAMNAVYDSWIDPENPPARVCVEARLADPKLRVEVTAIAALRG
jgi:enamine deaminase RidA (YjgF/YER057c/UK114 family)